VFPADAAGVIGERLTSPSLHGLKVASESLVLYHATRLPGYASLSTSTTRSAESRRRRRERAATSPPVPPPSTTTVHGALGGQTPYERLRQKIKGPV